MRSLVPIGIGLVLVLAGCGLEETGERAHPTGGESGTGAGGLLDGSFGGTGGSFVLDASIGGNAGSLAGAGGTIGPSGGGAAGSPAGGAAGSGATGGVTALDCAKFPNAVSFVLPTGQQHCYWVNNVGEFFPDARITCQNQSGYLASIHSAEENSFVQQLVSPAKYPDEEVWIAGSDGNDGMNPTLGKYVWLTNEPWTFENWESGEPNVSCEKCTGQDCRCEHRAALDVAGGGWNDLWQNQVLRFVCEAGAHVQ